MEREIEELREHIREKGVTDITEHREEILPVKVKKRTLTAKEILEKKDIETEDVHVPEWGGSVRLRMLTAGEAIAFTEGLGKDKKAAALVVLVQSAVDENGNPLFTYEDISDLKKKSLRAVMRIQRAALRINGLKDDEEGKEN